MAHRHYVVRGATVKAVNLQENEFAIHCRKRGERKPYLLELRAHNMLEWGRWLLALRAQRAELGDYCMRLSSRLQACTAGSSTQRHKGFLWRLLRVTPSATATPFRIGGAPSACPACSVCGATRRRYPRVVVCRHSAIRRS